MSSYASEKRAEFLNWCQAHDELFNEHAEELGLSDAQTEAFAAATVKAQLAIIAQNEAEQAALAATREAQAAIAGLRRDAGNIIRLIRAKARSSKNPLYFYNLAQIMPPAARTPGAPPPTPGNITATLEAATGTLTLRWKCRNPRGASGTHYILRRRLPGEGGFTFLGTAGTKSYVDATLPAAAEYADYTVQAVRGRRTGSLSPVFTVHMGVETPKRRNVETPKGQGEAGLARAATVPVMVGV